MKLKKKRIKEHEATSNNSLPPCIFPPVWDLKHKPSVISIDTECTGLHWAGEHEPFAFQMAYYLDGKLHTRYWEMPVDPYTRKPDRKGRNALNLFHSWYSDPEIDVVFANAKYDMHMIEEYLGYFPKGKIHDVILAAWSCNTREPSYKLNNLSKKYLARERRDEEYLKEVTRKARDKARKAGIPVADKLEQDYFLPRYFDHSEKSCQIYGLADAIDTLDLWLAYFQLMQDLGVWETYQSKAANIEVLYKMERRGVRFFEADCNETLLQIEKDLDELYEEISEELGVKDINLNSPKQLCEALFGREYDTLEPIPGRHEYAPISHVHPKGYTEKGKPSTGAKILQEYYSHIPIVRTLLKFRGYENGRKYCYNYKANSVPDRTVSYKDLPATIQGNKASFRSVRSIHTTFNQIAYEQGEQKGTRTGRLSSSEPNLHNVADPTKSTGQFVVDSRKFYGPRNGYRWYCIDYSQIELRIFAERIGGRLKQAFLAGKDPHQETANAVNYLANMTDKKKARQLGKHTNFTVINMGGAEVLNAQYNIPIDEGMELVQGFYSAYPEAKLRQKEAEVFARQNGYIETISGRRIHVDLTKKWNPKMGKATDKAYQATAYDVQGSAADIILRAMRRIQDYLNESSLNAHIVLQVHDELVIEVHNDHAYKWFLKKIKRIMEDNSDWMQIPTPVSFARTFTTWSSYDQTELKMV